jgi:Family of unknown function (DUF6088)
MTVSQKIEKQLTLLSEGTTFRYQGLAIEPSEYTAASKKIERLIASGILKRVSKGVFYKPKQSIFGALQPNETEILKQFLFKNGQRIAYITGVRLYHQMGLTTQIPAMIVIASHNRRGFVSIGYLNIKPAKSYVKVTNDNYELLGFLDAIKDLNRIPDLDKKSVFPLLTNQLKAFAQPKITELLQYSLEYPPRVRALLGALLDAMGLILELSTLQKSLNPLTKYNYGLQNHTLPNTFQWNLK